MRANLACCRRSWISSLQFLENVLLVVLLLLQTRVGAEIFVEYRLRLNNVVNSASSIQSNVYERDVNPIELVSAESLKHAVHFDFYVFSQSWQPQFCYHHNLDFPGCKNPTEFMRSHLTIHGLWPDANEGNPPDTCNPSKFNESVIDEIGKEKLMKYWPNVKSNNTSSDYKSFWAHEWHRHGTCSGLSQRQYLEQAIETLLQLETPKIIQMNLGNEVMIYDVLQSYGGRNSAVLKCKHGALSEVYTCWNKSANGTVTNRRICPTRILKESTCYGVKIKISSFDDEAHL